LDGPIPLPAWSLESVLDNQQSVSADRDGMLQELLFAPD
jgi:hypothetical protein